MKKLWQTLFPPDRSVGTKFWWNKQWAEWDAQREADNKEFAGQRFRMDVAWREVFRELNKLNDEVQALKEKHESIRKAD